MKKGCRRECVAASSISEPDAAAAYFVCKLGWVQHLMVRVAA